MKRISIFFLIVALEFISCKENPTNPPTLTLPAVTTNTVTEIAYTSAKSGGNVTSDGGSNITARGVCWATYSNPNTTDNKTINGYSLGTFLSTMTELISGTTYYVRAYATNKVGTGYGSEISFKTVEITLPTVTTTAITEVTAVSAKSGGNVTSDGGSAITARGVCWATNQSPTLINNKTTDGTSTGTFVSTINGLNPGTTYYIRAYATNGAGTYYGSEISFTTSSQLQIGDSYNDGIIDSLDNSGKHGSVIKQFPRSN